MRIVVGARIEDVEETLTCVTDLQHTSHVSAPVAVIRGTPYSAQAVVVEDLEAFLAQLMCPQNVRHCIDFEEFLHHLRAKGVARTARAQREFVPLRIWVTPHQVCHGPFVGYLAEAVDDFDLVNGVDRGGQAAMDAEDLVVDDDGQGEEVEHVGEVVPHVGVAVLARAFRVKAVRLRHAAGLVVAADEVHAVRVAQLQAHEERDGLDREEPAVDVVTCAQSAGPVAAACGAGRRSYPGTGSWCQDRARRF